MTMPTLYVAGPMTGIKDYNYPHFREVGDALRDCGYTVLNPVEVDAMHLAERSMVDSSFRHVCADCDEGRKHEWHWYMRRTLKMMLEADGVALLRGWERSRGAKVEVEVAKALGMPHHAWQNWVLRVREQDTEKPGRRRKKEKDA